MKQGFAVGARLAIAVSAGAAILAVWPGPGPLAAPVVRAAVLEGKTLEREEDHLVVVGHQLRALQGVPLSKLRLLAQTSKGFRVIPYQVDERRDNGDYVWEFGEDIEQDRDRGKLDYNDELVFCVRDSGDRVPRSAWPQDADRGMEIEIKDPVDGGKSWVYLLAYRGTPPAQSTTDNIDIEVREDGLTRFRGRNYRIDNSRSPYAAFRTTNFIVPPERGGSGRNWVDATQLRVSVNYLFFEVERRTDDVRIKVKSWIDGPVRVICNNSVEVYLVLGIWVSASDSRCLVYGNGSELPTTVTCPINLDEDEDEPSLYWLYLDLGPAADGMQFYNSHNPNPVTIDGRMGPEEKALDRSYPSWNVVMGKPGAVITRLLLNDERLRAGKRNALFYDDDAKAAEDPPEYHPGHQGAFGYILDFTGLTKGQYAANYVLHYPDRFRRGDEKKFILIHDRPLTTEAR